MVRKGCSTFFPFNSLKQQISPTQVPFLLRFQATAVNDFVNMASLLRANQWWASLAGIPTPNIQAPVHQQRRVYGKDGLHVMYTLGPPGPGFCLVVAKSENELRQRGYTGDIMQPSAGQRDPAWVDILADSKLYFKPPPTGYTVAK